MSSHFGENPTKNKIFNPEDPLRNLLLKLEKQVKKSKIAHDEASIPEWNHLQTSVIRYTLTSKEDAKKIESQLAEMKEFILPLKKHFSEDSEIKNALSNLNDNIEDISTEFQKLSQSQNQNSAK